jgi:dTDP-glucose pyrophosphorylase/CBS domain-containing protein
MDRTQLERIFVGLDCAVREAIESIDAGGVEIALVVDDERRLLGTISDGDIRRALLRGTSLDDCADTLANRSPRWAPVGATRDELLALMTEAGIEQVPLLQDGRVVDLVFIRELVKQEVDSSKVVIMAGGEGSRLRPLTEDVPKPMLPVGERPLLETVLGQVRESGFSKVLMAVNYRAEMIEDHFGDGEGFGVEIEYVREQEQLGSAGALQLVREQLDEPFIVMNADLLTKVNLGALIRFHTADRNAITVGVRQYALEVPYGVVEIEDGRVQALREKPTMQFFVNTGLYAVSPEAVKLLPPELGRFNMTDLIEAALASGARVGSFPVREYWLDIGQLADYERAHADHATYFAAT